MGGKENQGSGHESKPTNKGLSGVSIACIALVGESAGAVFFLQKRRSIKQAVTASDPDVFVVT